MIPDGPNATLTGFLPQRPRDRAHATGPTRPGPRDWAHADACKDEHEQLRVGAAVSTGVGTDEQVEALVDAGVDVIVVDTAHGHS